MKAAIGYCNEANAFLAGKKAAENAIEKGSISSPDFLFAFSSGQLDPDDFFNGVQSVVGPETPIIGGSAIGIITNEHLSYKGHPAGVAVIQSDRMKFYYKYAEKLIKGDNAYVCTCDGDDFRKFPFFVFRVKAGILFFCGFHYD